MLPTSRWLRSMCLGCAEGCLVRPSVREGWRRWRTWLRHARERPRAAARFARNLRKYARGILASAHFHMHTSVLEGVNNRIKVIKRMARGPGLGVLLPENQGRLPRKAMNQISGCAPFRARCCSGHRLSARLDHAQERPVGAQQPYAHTDSDCLKRRLCTCFAPSTAAVTASMQLYLCEKPSQARDTPRCSAPTGAATAACRVPG